MNLFDAAILGLVEGITEFLPISSTGHLILASTLLHLPSTAFLKSFEIAIQLGAILAVPVLYFRSFLSRTTLLKLIVAFIPTGIIGLIAYHFVKTYLLGNDAVVVWSLALGGLALIVFEWWQKGREQPEGTVVQITYRQAFFVGLFQSIAIIPGVSRSAASIVGGLALGIPRAAIVEFSFLLAVPTMLAATGLDLVKNAGAFASADFMLLAVGFIVSFIVALASIRFLLAYIRRYSFIPFGVYRILAALAFFFLILH